MLGRLGWRGGVPAVVFVTGLAGLIGNGSSGLWVITPWVISLGAVAAMMWAFGPPKD